MIKVEVLRHPTDADWLRCRELALGTVGKRVTSDAVSEAWKRRMLEARHSPIRTLMFTVRLTVPYYVSVHLVRHKHGVEHYVRSQRNDRQDAYDRTKAPQDAPVEHVMDLNAEALMTIANKRLCGKAAPETRRAVSAMAAAVVEVNPEFAPFLVPACSYHGGVCHEFQSCGRNARWQYGEES